MLTLIIALMVITVTVLGILYYASLGSGKRDFRKTKVNVPTDYDGMGTFSRYINK